MMHLSKFLLLISALFLVGCKKNRDFQWTSELAIVEGKDLTKWLSKVPLSGKWDLQADSSNNLVFSNQEQVFPFLGKVVNEEGTFNERNEKGVGAEVFMKKSIFFQKQQKGDAFAHAIILYEPKEFYLKSFVSTTGNVIFSGVDAINESYTASLNETHVFENNDDYKTGIYWVSNNYNTYLFGHYQRGKLIFQIAFPCLKEEAKKGLAILKQTSTSLNLNIPEWDRASVDDLQINQQPVGFWKDPFVGLYIENFLPKLKVKIKKLPFKSQLISLTKAKGVDFYYAYSNELGNYDLSFTSKSTSLNQVDFESSKRKNPFLTLKRGGRKLFYEETSTPDKTVIDAEVFFRNSKTLIIKAGFPSRDTIAKIQVFDILRSLQISVY